MNAAPWHSHAARSLDTVRTDDDPTLPQVSVDAITVAFNKVRRSFVSARRLSSLS